MIAKDTTTIVRFYATTTDGFPATGKASSITAAISMDGGSATAITDTIYEIDSTNLPGWYKFEHPFNTAGNAFITFTCANCKIMPWEEQVVEISTSPAPSASDIATAVWGANVRSLSTLSVTSGGISFDIATSNGVNQAIRVIKDYGDTKWLTASGFATPSDIPTSDISAIKTKTDNLPASPAAVGSAMTLTSAYDAAKTASQLTAADLPSDYAKPGDAMTLTAAYNAAKTASQFNAATDTVTINATQAATMITADVSGLATPADIPTADITAIKTKVDSLHNTDLTGIATSANVTAAQAAIIEHGDNNWTGGGSGGATAQQIWEYPTRTITASPTDISSLATKTDLAGSTSTLQTLLTNLLAGLYHWRVTNNVLTIYNDSNDAIATFSIARDPTGNIIAVTPINN